MRTIVDGKRKWQPWLSGVTIVAVAAWLLYLYAYPHERRAAEQYVSSLMTKNWSALYDLEQPDEKRLVGWSRSQFQSVMESMADGIEFELASLAQVSPCNVGRPGALYEIRARGPSEVASLVKLYVYRASGRYSIGVSDLPIQLAILLEKAGMNGFRRLNEALSDAGVEQLLNSREMLVVNRADISQLAAARWNGVRDFESPIPWRRLQGF